MVSWVFDVKLVRIPGFLKFPSILNFAECDEIGISFGQSNPSIADTLIGILFVPKLGKIMIREMW